jgi:hypothetical protein
VEPYNHSLFIAWSLIKLTAVFNFIIKKTVHLLKDTAACTATNN